MELLNSGKFLASILFLMFLAVVMKWSVDVCLPLHQGTHIFSSPQAPKPICEALNGWDLWAHERDAKISAQTNWYHAAPGLFENDDGNPSVFNFLKDAVKLTIVLSMVPMDMRADFQLMLLILVAGLIMAVAWEVIERVIATPVEGAHAKKAYRRRVTAMFKVMGDNTQEFEPEQRELKKRD